MELEGGRTRSTLRLPRVEFDLSALLLGAVAWFAYQWFWPLAARLLSVTGEGLRVGLDLRALRPATDQDVLRSAFFGSLIEGLRLPYLADVLVWIGHPGALFRIEAGAQGTTVSAAAHGVEPWKLAVTGVALLVLWSVFGGALARVHAVRRARDESVPFDEAFAFSLRNLRSLLVAPLFAGAAALFFLLLTILGGAGSAVPGAGPVLQVVLHPLALLSGLVVLVIGAGAVFGLPMMHAAVAAERNGSLDAVSRTFSYIGVRPVLFAFGAAVVFVVAGVVGAFGDWFLETTARAVRFGAGWNAEAAAAIDSGFGRVWGRGAAGPPEGAGLVGAGWHYVTWAYAWLGVLLVRGFVLSYVVGGLVDVYFLLRREVDGIDESQVYVEGEEAGLGEPVPGEPTPGTA